MRRKYVVMIHLLFWLLYTAVTTIPYTVGNISDDETRNIIIRLMISKFFLATIFYIYYFFIGPQLIFHNRLMLFIILAITFNATYSFLLYYVIPPIYYWVLGPSCEEVVFNKFYLSSVWYHFIYAVYGTLFRFTIDWFKKEQKRHILETQKVNAELAFLRSQINPKFLFYTLSELDSLLKTDPARTSEGIIKLSEIMRYMLYDAAASEIPLELEVSHIQNYIALQELLSGRKGMVKFALDGSIENRSVPPLLFIHFIENAIKHGKKNGHFPAIIINMTVNEELLFFETQNFIDEKKNIPDLYEGQGMKKIKRRMDLLFGGSYTLDIKQESEIFNIKLIIKNPWILQKNKSLVKS
jgi:two-component system, LytTR family, sensor kinase